MPVQRGRDNQGSFYRWGEHGKKYYYTTNNDTSRKYAAERARKQGIAIKINQGR